MHIHRKNKIGGSCEPLSWLSKALKNRQTISVQYTRQLSSILFLLYLQNVFVSFYGYDTKQYHYRMAVKGKNNQILK